MMNRPLPWEWSFSSIWMRIATKLASRIVRCARRWCTESEENHRSRAGRVLGFELGLPPAVLKW